MNDTDFLGPFHNLNLYQEEQLLLQLPQPESYATMTRLGAHCCFDFDVRPQRTCLTNGRHLRLTKDGADWEEILDRCIVSVAKTLGLTGNQYQVERGVEGADGNGAVTCWVRHHRTTRNMLATALYGIAERLNRQDWPKFHPEYLDQPDLAPGRDRISIQITDPKTHHTVPMLAENFYFVNSTKKGIVSVPLRDWRKVFDQLKK
jgi:hypothetical protein